MKRIFTPLFLVISGLAALTPRAAHADTQLTTADLTGAYQTKSYSGRVVCHDPSIFMDTVNYPKTAPRYYIYGSHLGRGYTTAALNYQSWTSFKAGEESATSSNSLFANTSGNLTNFKYAYTTHAVKQVKNCEGKLVDFGPFDANGWQYKGNNVQGMQWAPDVIYNPTMKKWLMYMSLNGDNWCSSIVCFASDQPEGPWVYQGPVVFSGFAGKWTHNKYAATNDYKNTDLELAIGTQASLPARYTGMKGTNGDMYGDYWPNCIDPCVFYDHEGKLWMSYGSWSGGIFILELDETTGLRDYTVKYPYEVSGKETTPGARSKTCTCDPYFGRKIAGGAYVSGEASYIERIGDYYFLFMSYGGFVSDGGYQMRVFRSDRPDGPYKDCTTAAGISAIFSGYAMNYSATATSDRGVKLMAGYQWDTMSAGELAQGHNSAIVDHEGRALLVYHTRFNTGGEGHQVRVHQLFLNEDGWIMASPYEFSGETPNDMVIASKQLYSADEVAGDYQFMAHPYRQDTKNKVVETPVNIRLNADGSITGSYTGSWSLVEGTSYIHLKLKGTKTANKEVEFKGVLTRQTIDFTNISALCFTALSSSNGTAGTATQTRGLSVWGSKADAKAAIKYTADKTTLANNATSDITLPIQGKLGANITWTSSDTNILSNAGKVLGNGTVSLTATITKDGYAYDKTFTLNVKGGSGTGGDSGSTAETFTEYPEAGTMDFTNAFFTMHSSTYTLKAGNTYKFMFYNYTKGEFNWQNWVLMGCDSFTNGKVNNEYFGVRCDNWDNTIGNNTGCTSNYDWDIFKQEMNGSFVSMTCTYDASGNFKMSANIKSQYTGRVYTYTYTKTIAAKPAQITLFFTTEASYLGPTGPHGESLGIEAIQADASLQPTVGIYDLYGRRRQTLGDGLQIRNGHKVMIR